MTSCSQRQPVRSFAFEDFCSRTGGVCATFADITKEKEVEEQLRQSSKLDAIGRLVGGAAHDFNNVLATVFGGIDLALEAKDRDSQEFHLNHALEAAQTGSRLTHRLLAFARKQPLSPTVVRPSLVLSNLSGMLRTLLGEQIDIEFVYDAGIWSIEVDRNQLEHAIVNLAINARDAMPKGGKITIEATNARVDDEYAKMAGIERGQYVCISCTDTGAGMDKDVLEKVFEPFFTTKEAGEGTGLGLAMVHGFIRQSNGHIAIYSEVDQGTVVKIYLPRIDAPLSPEVQIETKPQKRPNTEIAVLVVEDNSLLRKTVVAQLESAGYVVSDASEAASAIELVQNGGVYDVLLTDVVLPNGTTGRQLAEKICTAIPAVKVIFMSGYSENSIIHQGRMDKGVKLLQKPFRKIDLVREIDRAMQE